MIRGRYRHRREKMFSIIFMVVVFVALLSLLAFGISAQADPFLLVVLAVIILILVPVAIFFMDVLHFET